MLSLLANDLAEASRDDMTARLLERTPHQARIRLEDLLKPLDLIAANLPASSCRRMRLKQLAAN